MTSSSLFISRDTVYYLLMSTTNDNDDKQQRNQKRRRSTIERGSIDQPMICEKREVLSRPRSSFNLEQPLAGW